ncbi:MAG: ABC transporter permease [Actinomycetota bacterium]|nr:ABC transporter permease [Actinomycetota bacterium]
MSTAAEVPFFPTVRRRAPAARLWSTRNGRLGLVVVAALVLVALAAAFEIMPYSPLAQHAADRFTPPSGEYWLGTDQFGRDVASRIMAGVLASLRVAALSVALASVGGSLAGIVAGFFGGWVDRAIGRVADVLFAFPAILLALAILAALGRGWLNTALAIAIVYTPIFIRVARGPVLSVREAEYVKAGRGLGYGSGRLLFRHVLPNVAAPIIVQVALALSWAILTESSLSFLGLGTQPPEPSLGLMVSEARTLASRAWWLLAFPSLAIIVAVIGLNLLGDGLRDALDPTRSE